ncbi:MAG: aromatic ring-opening dioxygenase subunit LigB [Thermomicrobiales bacterium]
MPMSFAAVAPHGFPIIPELSDDAEGALATRAAMYELGERFKKSGVEVIVIAGPHGVRVEGTICLANVARAAGTLFWNDREVELNVPVDARLTDEIASKSEAQRIPIALAGYAGNRRDQSALPMDWGVLTPLWFLGHGRQMKGYGHVLADVPETDVGVPVVIVTPSRSLPRQAMVEFGRTVADAAAGETRKVAFIASCDWGHCHRADGPYGYHEASARVDKQVVDAIEGDKILSLIDLPEQDVQDAAIDGLWQILMLGGILDSVPMRHELLSYEAPSYYGMIVASFEPER